MAEPEALGDDEQARAALKRTCEREAAELVDTILTDMKLRDTERLQPAVLLTDLAAARGDAIALREWGEHLSKPGFDSEAVAMRAFYLGHELEDMPSSERLMELLSQEQTRIRGILIEEGFTPDQYEEYAPSLAAIVEICAQRQSPIDTWKSWAINDAHIWTLWQVYHRKLTHQPDQAAPSHATEHARQQLVAPLIESEPGMSAEFIARAITYTLTIAPDAETKRKLLAKYRGITPDRPLDIHMALNLADCGSRVVFDDDINTTETIAWFEETIDSIKQQVMMIDSLTALDRLLIDLPWQLASSWRQEANADRLVALVDELMYAIPEIQPLHVDHVPPTWANILMIRDRVLNSFAGFTAAKGEFKASGRLAHAMMNDDAREDTLKACMEHADTPNKLIAYLPPDQDQAFRQNTITHVFAKLLIMGGHPDHIHQEARKLVNKQRQIPFSDRFLARTTMGLVVKACDLDVQAGESLIEELAEQLDTGNEAHRYLALRLRTIRLQYNRDLALRQSVYEEARQLSNPKLRINNLITLAQLM